MGKRLAIGWSFAVSLGCAGLAPGVPVVAEPPAPMPEPEVPEVYEEPDGPEPGDEVDGPERGVPSPRPAPGQEVIPVLSRLFEGDFPTSGFIDHDGPREPGQLTPWGEVVSGRSGHKGHDYVMPVGTPLLAVADGIVERARDQGQIRCGKNTVPSSVLVRVRHPGLLEGDDLESVYLHLSKVAVQEGASVRAGDVVGYSGNSGCSSGPHLHFGILRAKGGKRGEAGALDPYGWAGEGSDPFDPDNDGRSPWLWKEGQAPALFRIASAHPSRKTDGPQIRRMVTTTWRDDPLAEIVEIGITANGGPKVDLGGWSLADRNSDASWTFARGTVLQPGTLLRVISGKGDDGDGAIYMDRDAGLWEDTGTCIELRDRKGRAVHQLDYAKGKCPEGS